MRIFHFAAVAGAIALAGCANTAEMRRLSALNAAVANDYRSELKKFADGQTALNAGNEARLRDLDVLRSEREAESAHRTLALEVADEEAALAIVRLLSAKRAPQVLDESRALKSLAPPPPAAIVTFDAGQVEALTKKLKALATPPDRWARALSGLAFAEELRAAYGKSLADADRSASKAQQEAAAQTARAITQAAKADGVEQ